MVVGREDGAARAATARADGDAAVTSVSRAARPGRAEAARLALGQPAVAAHVAVLAARDQVDGRLVAHVLDLAHRGGVHAREAAGAEHVLAVVVKVICDAAAVDEVELLLLVVEVAAGLEAGRDLDRVHAERGHAQLAPDLAEAGALGQPSTFATA